MYALQGRDYPSLNAWRYTHAHSKIFKIKIIVCITSCILDLTNAPMTYAKQDRIKVALDIMTIFTMRAVGKTAATIIFARDENPEAVNIIAPKDLFRITNNEIDLTVVLPQTEYDFTKEIYKYWYDKIISDKEQGEEREKLISISSNNIISLFHKTVAVMNNIRNLIWSDEKSDDEGFHGRTLEHIITKFNSFMALVSGLATLLYMEPEINIMHQLRGLENSARGLKATISESLCDSPIIQGTIEDKNRLLVQSGRLIPIDGGMARFVLVDSDTE